MRKSSCGHVIGVPVTSKAYALEEATTRGAGAAKKDGDRLAVSLTHPSPYASFGYKHSTSSIKCSPSLRSMPSMDGLSQNYLSDDRMLMAKLVLSGSKGQVIHWVNKLGRRAQGFRDHGESAFGNQKLEYYIPNGKRTVC